MKAPYIADLVAGEAAAGTFLVLFKEARLKKSGEHYLSLTLGDKTGDIDAKMWDNVDKILDTFERDDFIRIKGMPQVFQNRLQLTVHTIQRVEEREVELGDFFPASARDPEEMWRELLDVIGGIRNPHLTDLLLAIFTDPEIERKFKRAPAAKSIHHAWFSGLIEHVLSMCTLVKNVAPHYPYVDQDMVMTGAILHDIGKVDELTYDRTFGYSDEGQLIGHIQIGLRMIDDKVRTLPNFPPRLRTLVDHMVLSHHGQLEFGSPKLPLSAEAMLLHHLDNLDSKMETMRGAVARDKLEQGSFTAYVSSIERPVLKRDRYLNPPPPPPPKPVTEAKPGEGGRKPAGPVNSALGDQLRQALGKK